MLQSALIMKLRSSRVIIALATTLLLVSGCVSEKELWKAAESGNTISAYQDYLRSFPQGEFSSEARSRLSKLTNNARVVIDCPSTLASQESYHNISGPVWVYTIKFLEVSGTQTVIRTKRMQIFATDGTVWGDMGDKEIYDDSRGTTTITLNPYETDSYTTWVNSPGCQLCGAKLTLDFSGEDSNGHFISLSTSFTLIRK